MMLLDNYGKISGMIVVLLGISFSVSFALEPNSNDRSISSADTPAKDSSATSDAETHPVPSDLLSEEDLQNAMDEETKHEEPSKESQKGCLKEKASSTKGSKACTSNHPNTMMHEADLDSSVSHDSNNMPSIEEKKIDISGFITFLILYMKVVGDENTSINGFWGTTAPTFGLGNINLIFDGRPHPMFRAFIELRFFGVLSNFEPGHSGVEIGSFDTWINPVSHQYVLSVSNPPRHFDETGNQSNVGGIILERAFMSFMPRDQWLITAGQFLTPYGIFNLDHGDLVITSIRYPYITAAEIIPKSMLGIQISGSLFPSDWRLEYYAYVGNQNSYYQLARNVDLLREVAGGGRIALSTPKCGKRSKMSFGVSGYYGNDIQGETLMGISNVDEDMNPTANGVEAVQWKYESIILNRVLAVDASINLGTFLFQSELMISYNTVRNSTNPKYGALIPYSQHSDPNFLSGGFYTQVEYLLFKKIRPYFRMEYIVFNDSLEDAEKPYIYVGGINIRPFPFFVLKADAVYVKLSEKPFYNFSQLSYEDYWTFGISSSLAF